MNQKSDVFVALSVIASSILLLGALVFAVLGNPFEQPHLKFSVDFQDVSGIGQNSEVRYAGSTIGLVNAVEMLPKEERRDPDEIVRLHVSIIEPIDLPANIKVAITSASMLGERFVALKRVDDEGGLLADGSILSAGTAPSMLEDMAPGSSVILANIDELVTTLTGVVAQLNGEDGDGLLTTVTNVAELTGSLKTVSADLSAAFSGEGDDPGFKTQIDEVLENLGSVSDEIDILLKGTEDDPGLSEGTKQVVSNLEAFSGELTALLAGTETEVGLRKRVDTITEEIHVLLAGPANQPDEALRRQLLNVTGEIDRLAEELQVMIVWGQYVTGTLAEKPNRLIFGSKANEVPSKEELLSYIRKQKPYPVVIKANDEIEDKKASPTTKNNEPATNEDERKRLFKRH